MAGLIRVRSIGERRRRAGLAFSREWQELDGTQVNEAQFLAILEDSELEIQFAPDSEAPEYAAYPNRELSIEVLHDHVAYDLERGRPHDPLVQTEEFQSAQGAEGRSEDGAPASVAPEAKDDEVKDASSSDPEGTAPAAAAEAGESREGADDAVAGQDSASDEEKQPEQSLQAPVAAQDSDDTDGGKPAGSRRRKA